MADAANEGFCRRRAFSPKPEAAAGMEAFPKKLIVFLHTVRAAKVMTGAGGSSSLSVAR